MVAIQQAWNRLVFGCAYVLSYLLIGLLFPVRTSGTQHLPRRGPLLVLANHQSFLDPILLGLTMVGRAHYLARANLFRVPLRWVIVPLGAIALDQRGIAKSGLKKGLEQLELGRTLVLFPEGSRTNDGELAELQKGVLLYLRRSKAPIVVAGISGAFDAWPRQRLLPWRAPVWVHYEPLKADTSPQNPDALERLRESMQSAFEKAETHRCRLARLGPWAS